MLMVLRRFSLLSRSSKKEEYTRHHQGAENGRDNSFSSLNVHNLSKGVQANFACFATVDFAGGQITFPIRKVAGLIGKFFCGYGDIRSCAYAKPQNYTVLRFCHVSAYRPITGNLERWSRDRGDIDPSPSEIPLPANQPLHPRTQPPTIAAVPSDTRSTITLRNSDPMGHLSTPSTVPARRTRSLEDVVISRKTEAHDVKSFIALLILKRPHKARIQVHRYQGVTIME